MGSRARYALRKDLWTFGPDRIAVRFQYESLDVHGDWWRSYGNELWEFASSGLMKRREASINDVRIAEGDRRILGRERPETKPPYRFGDTPVASCNWRGAHDLRLAESEVRPQRGMDTGLLGGGQVGVRFCTNTKPGTWPWTIDRG